MAPSGLRGRPPRRLRRPTIAALVAALAFVAAVTAGGEEPRRLPLGGLDLLPPAGDATRCEWSESAPREPRRLQVRCYLNREAEAAFSRQLCFERPLPDEVWGGTTPETPWREDEPPAAGRFSSRLSLDGGSVADVAFDFSATATGTYWMNVTERDGRTRTFEHVVRPGVTIRVYRPISRQQPDRIVCEADGEYGQGVMTLFGCGDEVLHRVPFVRPGDYSTPKIEAVLERDGGRTRWTYRFSGGRLRQEYRCRLTPYGCDDASAGESPRVVTDAEEVRVSYARAHDATAPGQVPYVWTVCCDVAVPEPVRVGWRYGRPCEAVTELGAFYPQRDPLAGRFPVGDNTSDVSLHYRVMGSSAAAAGGLRRLQTCLRSDEPSLDLRPGDYECVVDAAHGVLYQSAIQIQENLDVRLSVTGDGVVVGCLVRDRLSGRLEVERLDDGQVLVTYPLDDTRHRHQNGSDGLVSWRYEHHGTGGTLFQVRLSGAQFRDAGFRCRVTDGCSVRASPPLTRWTEELRRRGAAGSCTPKPDRTPFGDYAAPVGPFSPIRTPNSPPAARPEADLPAPPPPPAAADRHRVSMQTFFLAVTGIFVATGVALSMVMLRRLFPDDPPALRPASSRRWAASWPAPASS